jgi:SAM-dependent methyltransferase
MTVERGLQDYYGQAAILDRIDAGLRATGADPQAPSLDALKPVDEFHTGGVLATQALLDPLGLAPQRRVLDIGCGIGGVSRYVADRYGAQVTGVDLTPGFVAIATELSRRVGLADQTAFHTGSALDLPVPDGGFDLAVLFHVGMNIADKAQLFAEAARALAPGGRFAVFDIMRGHGKGEITFPVPWSPDAAHSFVAPPETYRSAAAAAGLTLEHERDRGQFARAFFAKAVAAVQEHGVPHIGLHLLMGEAAPERYANAIAAANADIAYPWEMVFRKPA